MRNVLLRLILLVPFLGGALAAVPPRTQAAPAARAPGSGVSGAAIVQYALRFLGYPYTATGNSPSTGFSCIGFVSYVYQSEGINLPDDLAGAMSFAPPVAFADLQPGDVLYFQNTVWTGLSHTAIYLGGGRFVHAEWYNRGVVISSFTGDPIDGDYWTAHYLGANRPWGGVASAVPAPVQSSAGAPSAPAASQRPAGPRVRVRVSSLNVRARPSYSAGVETAVVRGTRLVILGHRWGWFRVALPDGTYGWVVGPGIGRGAALRPVTRTRLARPVIPRRQAVAPRLALQGRVVAQVNGLRVHLAPSVSAGVLSSVGRGQALPVVRSTASWVEIELADGHLGWISRQFASPSLSLRRATALQAATGSGATRKARAALNVRVLPSLSAAIVSVLPPGGSYALLGWRAGWAHVRLSSGASGWISGAVLGTYGSSSRPAVKAPTLSGRTAATGRVAAAALNVRQTPSLGAAIVSVLPPGGGYHLLRWSSGWAHVRLASGVTGWISGAVLGNGPAGRSASAIAARGTAASAASTSTGPTVRAGVRLHAAPDVSSAAVGLVARRMHVQILGGVAGWTRVRLQSGQTGYVLGSFVTW